MTFPNKKYCVIYADPAWEYDNGGPHGGVDAQYQTMALEDIKALPVKDIADNPCVLLLWATFPKLPEALEVIHAWGFDYKTLGFSWIKRNPDGSPFFGVGYYAKSNCEVCLLGTKGKTHSLVKSNSVSSHVTTKIQKHSRKPAEVRERIDMLFGNVPKIELFARDRVEGWDCWGNEIPNSEQATVKRWTFQNAGWV